MKAKKKETYNPVKARQIELLSKYYEIDEENKVVKVTLAYEKASELFVTDYASEEHPEFKEEILSRVSDILSRIPLDYKADLSFAIDDYEGYDPNKLLESFNDLVEMNNYEGFVDGRKKGLRIALLLIAGIISLVLMISGTKGGWFGEDSTKDLITEIIDIIGWVFIWEAVSIIFLSPNEEKIRSVKLKTRVNSISFKDGNNGKILTEEKGLKAFESWHGESKTKRASKSLLLISGSGFLAVATSTLISGISDISSNASSYGTVTLISYLAFTILFCGFMIVSGIGAISSYLDRGPLKKAVPYFAIINIIIGILGIVLSFAENDGAGNWKFVVSSIVSFILFLLYGAGWLLGLNKAKESKEK